MAVKPCLVPATARFNKGESVMAVQNIGSTAGRDSGSTAGPIGRHEQANLSYMMIATAMGDIAAPFRTFMDSWFAYHVGGPLLNANSRPHWLNNPCPMRHRDALLTAHWVSASAAFRCSDHLREAG